jgi:hypothetical protein
MPGETKSPPGSLRAGSAGTVWVLLYGYRMYQPPFTC